MRHTLAITANLKTLNKAFRELCERHPDVPGMGVLTGATGSGKSTAIDWLVQQSNGVYVRAIRSWSLNTMLAALCAECYGGRLNRNADMVSYIVEHLRSNRRPVFIDEGDHLLKSLDMLETLRDIHDLSGQPLIVVGMDEFEKRIVHRKQFARRVLQWVRFRPLDLDDARIFVNTVCEVKVADDLVLKLHADAAGSIGLMAVGVALVEAYAKDQDLEEISAKDWGDRQLVFTRPPRGSH